MVSLPVIQRRRWSALSPSRVRVTAQSGLDCTSKVFGIAAGGYADIVTLAAAHELGMQCTRTIMASAARRNRLAEMQYLHSQSCPWSGWMLELAVGSG
jgi:hypothetical protein